MCKLKKGLWEAVEELEYQVHDGVTETGASKSTVALSKMFQNMIGKADPYTTKRRRRRLN
jgi:4-hydroxy-3-methylbut-2-en-1-yl diphosphate synthase IspG/GcpE